MGVPVIGCPCEVCQSRDKRGISACAQAFWFKKGRGTSLSTAVRISVTKYCVPGIQHLTALVFTHEHKDHTAGMDDVRAFNFIQRKAVQIYASSDVEKALRNDFHYAFADIKYPGVPEIKINNIEANKPFTIEGLEWKPILVYHHRMPVLGFRIEDFTYITDANTIPDEEWSKLEGTKVLVLNALRKQTHISHFSLEEALEVIERIQPERAYLTHISHQMGTHEEVSATLPGHVFIAEDGLKITL